MDTSVVDRFCRRLEQIGVTVELFGNYPWVYMGKVNGKRVKGLFEAEHGFTAFYTPTRIDGVARFSDRKVVFAKVREVLSED